MDVSSLAFEWTDTSRHWLIEVPIRIVVYIAVALVIRYLVHRMIDRATTGRTRKNRGGGEDARPQRTPPLVRRLRDRVPSSTTSEQIIARRQQRAQTIGSVLKSTVSIVLLVWVVLAVLNVVGVNIAPFIASAGVVGLAIGFGAQNLVRDFVTGVFMLLEDQYGVGDTVDLGEAVGEVESVGLRITTVRDIDGTLWYVRNGEIARVGNMSQEYAVARIEVPVALSADIERAEQVAVEAAEAAVAEKSLAGKVLGEPEMLGVQELSPDLIKLRMTVKVRPNAQWAVQRRLRRAILQAYDEHGIALPYPNGRVHAVGE
ncbi:MULTISPECIES: mechanosensitive ion channel family protein [Mycolicibacterium]|uniref:Small-conductance mechanosensitive channel n=3 Tax=Mycolicibacterium gilvum TaxID=1804 RepID=E6TFB6_MYCSR|nr:MULTISPECIES: mechanosensitive ion channel domain-containing protein [Mycolicibacterium]ABP45221.1 MscS mechanosensitive ion channel [Mycolicibacterium gilvum PYR-GCK]ADT98832.1 small-conductance mechanosensitive channel [Mycolicibacterium gilvum Spyr1]MBV5243253.1 mechanosensitive ion channel family protein [Mycolicibacterium sp. PAM1]MCV7055008.1 mechanosensitive ion channel [Mycolicibacterium gilvum]STZ44465.1 mechanosensitive ion channel MscS [Mycolicibacterium gilvum]